MKFHSPNQAALFPWFPPFFFLSLSQHNFLWWLDFPLNIYNWLKYSPTSISFLLSPLYVIKNKYLYPFSSFYIISKLINV